MQPQLMQPQPRQLESGRSPIKRQMTKPRSTTLPTGRDKGGVLLVLMGLVFLLSGLAVLIFSPLDTLYTHWQSAGWDHHPVRLEAVELKESQGDSTTYQVVVRYRYEYGGNQYVSHQVGYDQSRDNLGSYHQDTYRTLRSILDKGGHTRAWVNPAKPQHSLLRRDLRAEKLFMMSVFGIVFAGIGLFLLISNSRRSQPAYAPQGVEVIHCNQQQGYWLFAFMAFCFLAVSSPGVYFLSAELSKGNWAMLFVLLFPLAGLWLAAQAWKAWRNWRFYGPMPLVPDPSPGQLGGHIGGEISLQHHWPDSLPISVNLQCIRTTRSGSSNSRSTHQSILWQKSMPAYLEHPGSQTLIRFQFEAPAELPVSEPPSNNYVHWQIAIEGQGLNRIPLERSYQIPVIQGQQRCAKLIPTAVLERQQRHAQVKALQDVAGQVDIEQHGDSLHILNRAGRNWGFHLAMLMTGAIMIAIGGYIGTNAAKEGFGAYLLAGIFLLIAIPLSLSSLFSIARSKVVIITGNHVITRRYWLGIPLWQHHASLTSATQLELANYASYTSGTRMIELFHINLKHAGRNLRLAENIRGREAAESLRDSLVQLLKLPT